jgi:hypothetical protein
MNIAILIALLSGEALLVAGTLTVAVTEGWIDYARAAVVGIVLLAVLIVVTPILVLRLLMDRERDRIIDTYHLANRQSLAEMVTAFGIPAGHGANDSKPTA